MATLQSRRRHLCCYLKNGRVTAAGFSRVFVRSDPDAEKNRLAEAGRFFADPADVRFELPDQRCVAIVTLPVLRRTAFSDFSVAEGASEVETTASYARRHAQVVVQMSRDFIDVCRILIMNSSVMSGRPQA
jgi:hypothetical protein